MITAFSQNDVNDINQVLSDENFERYELELIWTALTKYQFELADNKKIATLNAVQGIIKKVINLIQSDLENE